ncbi:hypothetical protein H0H93_000726, partial [Arthromyces matolae]
AFTGTVPFANIQNDSAITYHIMSGNRPSRPLDSSLAWHSYGLTEPMWLLMQKCWERDPHKRPSVKDIVTQLKCDISFDGATSSSIGFRSPGWYGPSPDLITISDIERIMAQRRIVHPRFLETSNELASPMASVLSDSPTLQAP